MSGTTIRIHQPCQETTPFSRSCCVCAGVEREEVNLVLNHVMMFEYRLLGITCDDDVNR